MEALNYLLLMKRDRFNKIVADRLMNGSITPASRFEGSVRCWRNVFEPAGIALMNILTANGFSLVDMYGNKVTSRTYTKEDRDAIVSLNEGGILCGKVIPNGVEVIMKAKDACLFKKKYDCAIIPIENIPLIFSNIQRILSQGDWKHVVLDNTNLRSLHDMVSEPSFKKR